MTVRLYHIYNTSVGKHGTPFALCDRYAKEQRELPSFASDQRGPCIQRKLAEKTSQPCNQCEEG